MKGIITMEKRHQLVEVVCFLFPLNPLSLFAFLKTECGWDSQCNKGVCNATRCLCKEEYAGAFCDIKRRSRLAVFLLDFFFGYLGVGRFMMGLIATAVIKLILTCVSGVFTCFIPCAAMCDNLGCIIVFGIIDVGLALAAFGWFVLNVISF